MRTRYCYDFFSTGTYNRKRDFILTTSPSMDILISSNLERLIYRITGEDPDTCAQLMEALSKGGEYTITPEMKAQLADFYGNFCTEEETSEAIRQVLKRPVIMSLIRIQQWLPAYIRNMWQIQRTTFRL